MKIKVEHTKNISGNIKISGSKNTTLPLMVCSMLTKEKITLNNVPNISDVIVLKQILEDIGIKIEYDLKSKIMTLENKKLKNLNKNKLIKKLRASIYVIGGLVANKKHIKTYYPGGCSFSDRPINYHIDIFKKLGYYVKEKNNIVYLKKIKSNNKKITFKLPKKSVGTTINILYTSVKRKNYTIIENASLEPEVLEVINMLNKMGACIKIYNDSIVIKGVKKLNGVVYDIISDRIEAGSYMLLASAVDTSDVLIENVDPKYLEEVINTIKELGVKVEVNKNSIRIKKEYPIKGINKISSYYPMFPTDLQQILCTTCLNAITSSVIIDEVYPKRLSHLEEIHKLNGHIEYKNNKIYIENSHLISNNLYAHDLRCGFACIIMSVLSNEYCYIENFEIVLRGYEDIIKKITSLKIKVKIVE